MTAKRWLDLMSDRRASLSDYTETASPVKASAEH